MRARLESREPGAKSMALPSDMPGDGMRAEHKETAEVAVAAFADPEQPGLSPCRVLPRH